MMLKKRAVFIGLILLICADAHIHAATPEYFHESTYTALDQLDQALEEGEITYDDYLLLMESFLGSPDDNILTDETIKLKSADTVAAVEGGKSAAARWNSARHRQASRGISQSPLHCRDLSYCQHRPRARNYLTGPKQSPLQQLEVLSYIDHQRRSHPARLE